MTLCPCLCLLELGVLAKRLDELSCSVAQMSRSTYRALCCRETGPALARMRLLASASLSQTLHGLRKFRHDTSIVATCCQLVRKRWTLQSVMNWTVVGRSELTILADARRLVCHTEHPFGSVCSTVRASERVRRAGPSATCVSLAACGRSEKHKATVWCMSVGLSICLSVCLSIPPVCHSRALHVRLIRF